MLEESLTIGTDEDSPVTKKLGLKPRPFRTALILFNFID